MSDRPLSPPPAARAVPPSPARGEGTGHYRNVGAPRPQPGPQNCPPPPSRGEGGVAPSPLCAAGSGWGCHPIRGARSGGWGRGGLLARCALCLAAALLFFSLAAGAAPGPARQAELKHLVRQDCGACHGLTLQGGLGSPLTAAALADRPDDSLVATLLNGRPGSAMPPWRPFLSEDEARWVIQWLKQGATP